MKRNTLNFVVDLLAFLVMLGLIWTGFLIHLILVPGSLGGRGLTLWGMDRHEYGEIHTKFAVGLIILMVLHVLLHWNWVYHTSKCLFCTPDSTKVLKFRQRIYGLVLLVLLIILMIGSLVWVKGEVAFSQASADAHSAFEGEGYYGGDQSKITGQTTLAEAAAIGGMPVAELIEKLALPVGTDHQSRLGPLKRQYGFEIQDVRRICGQEDVNR